MGDVMPLKPMVVSGYAQHTCQYVLVGRQIQYKKVHPQLIFLLSRFRITDLSIKVNSFDDYNKSTVLLNLLYIYAIKSLVVVSICLFPRISVSVACMVLILCCSCAGGPQGWFVHEFF